ncbi:creatininase family protein [Clostridium intestinale]|uniref:Creatininase family protein n=1 Tax=Clostridium intestinale TaxID=36845 RepID=A0A7D6ZRZ1_9CLOT|nr:creatininase family protein [Clostridium intestinale]QLY78213.1 creatininase family protein [Clostridium intestinale]
MSVNVLELCWTEIQKLNKEKTVMIIGIAPIEQHGRHLPVGVDVYETEHWIKKSIIKLQERFSDYKFLTMPIIPFGNANMKGFPGNIHISQKLLYNLVLETLNSIAEWDIKNIIIISGHADPKHLIAIEEACECINKKFNDIAFSPMGAIFSEKVKCEEKDTLMDKLKKYSNDFHAGWVETSCMLSINKDIVNENYKFQPDIELQEKEMIFTQKVAEKIKGYGHIGYPKEGSKELGDALNEDAAKKIKTAVEAFILRENYKQYEHHELYKIPFLRVRIWS